MAFFRAVQILCLQHNTCKTHVSSIDLIELGLPKIHIYHIWNDLHKAGCSPSSPPAALIYPGLFLTLVGFVPVVLQYSLTAYVIFIAVIDSRLVVFLLQFESSTKGVFILAN